MTLKRQVKARDFGRVFSDSLRALYETMPEASNAAAKIIGEEAVEIAKQYVSGERDAGWDALWVGPEGPGPGTWTPEFNAEHRASNRDSDQPLFDTGELYNAIEILGLTRTSKSGSMAIIGVRGDEDLVGKALKHEFGGDNPLTLKNGESLSDIPARPFLAPAIDDVENDYGVEMMIKDVIGDMLTAAARTSSKKRSSNQKAKKRKRKK